MMKNGLICLALLAPAAAHANATLQIVQGTGELQTYPISITVSTPVDINFRWWTDQKKATAGTWTVTKHNQTTPLKSGESTASPTVGDLAQFTIPAAAFPAPTPPSSSVTYDVTIQPHDTTGALGPPSSPKVTVKQVASGPQKPIQFGAAANYPQVALTQYRETIQQPANTEFFNVTATVKVTATNPSASKKTDAVLVSITDDNGLYIQTEPPLKIKSLPPKGSVSHTFNMTARWPAPQSQLPQPQQFNTWKKQYDTLCGVDLRVLLDWAGSSSTTPAGDHQQLYLYQGYGNSKSWEEGHPITEESECWVDDGNNTVCVNLNTVARSIYRQLACKVVGYSFFVGSQLSGSHGILGAFGKARTSSDPPETDFAPTTKMQIASTSKVLTALAGMKLLGSHLDDVAFNMQLAGGKTFNAYPKGWQLSEAAKKIRFSQFLSQTSGIREYYSGPSDPSGAAALQAFFALPVFDVNAPMTCLGGQQSHSCTNLQTDNTNCGSCGKVSPNGCFNGQPASACATGMTNCAPAGGPAHCIDTQNDGYNCGKCGNACPVNNSCSKGACVCSKGFTSCGGACVNLQTDAGNCGKCGATCKNANVCAKGACVASCPTGTVVCGASCVNTKTDFNNCGTCYNPCDPSQSCVNSSCTCNNTALTNSCFVQDINPIVNYDTTKTWCYSNTNFAIMRLLLPRFEHLNKPGGPSDDPVLLASQYVTLVQSEVFTPVGVSNVSCAQPSQPYALPYSFPLKQSGDFKDTTLTCGDWGWYVSAEEYAKVLLDLDLAHHNILNDCDFYKMEHNPFKNENKAIGWDIGTHPNTGQRWVEKNGSDTAGSPDANGIFPVMSTTVGIYGGHSGCKSNTPPSTPHPGVATVLFVNSNVGGAQIGAPEAMTTALAEATTPACTNSSQCAAGSCCIKAPGGFNVCSAMKGPCP
jgi:hypothetical protein